MIFVFCWWLCEFMFVLFLIFYRLFLFPPILLSSFSWLYGYLHIHNDYNDLQNDLQHGYVHGNLHYSYICWFQNDISSNFSSFSTWKRRASKFGADWWSNELSISVLDLFLWRNGFRTNTSKPLGEKGKGNDQDLSEFPPYNQSARTHARTETEIDFPVGLTPPYLRYLNPKP